MHMPLLSRTRFLALLLAALVVAVPLAVAPPADAAVKKPLDIVKVYYDPPGRDYSKNSEYVKEYIQVKNTGKTTLTLTGYVIRDNGPQKYTFPKGTKLAPGKTLTIRSGKGKDTTKTKYWNKSSYIWNNTGDTARLYTNKGKLLESCKYKGGVKKATSTTVRTDATTAYC
ncbi:lamin tail domain-containing protein [Brachybacterium sp. Marseille-Q7125]|uniref:lamin tail domain-containing protein n=1 Tax=Brachybacterium sp. Marseille-Q7125 TaxID=2932815 RepID=UPI001FF30F88|nr:lamin tail domain-containing protein [Brachybacterium sp. Marseille-Q7125]